MRPNKEAAFSGEVDTGSPGKKKRPNKEAAFFRRSGHGFAVKKMQEEVERIVISTERKALQASLPKSGDRFSDRNFSDKNDANIPVIIAEKRVSVSDKNDAKTTRAKQNSLANQRQPA